MRTVAVIQARMGSTRLPGKVMMDLGGKPVLRWVVRACWEAIGIDRVVVATTTLPADDEIVNYCTDTGIDWFRGSETDVLDRYIQTAIAHKAGVILRLTGDCPFLDPRVISEVVALQKRTQADFVTNVSPRTYPDGLDVQCMTSYALFSAEDEAKRAIDRDGVCTWIERNRSRFQSDTLICPIPGLEKERWVLDTEDDLVFCRAVAEHWPYSDAPSMMNILHILDKHPEIRNINKHHICNERYTEALAKEPLYERTFERSKEALSRSKQIIPLGAQTFSKSHLQYPQPSPLFISHGQGAQVWDIDGNEFIDLVSALLPNVLGLRDPDVDAAIRRQLSSGISFSLSSELEYQLAATLCHLIPCAEMVRFGKTGSDVTSAAVRLARAYTGRHNVTLADEAYHGWHDWAVAETPRGMAVPLNGSVRVSREYIANHCDFRFSAAVIVEPDAWDISDLKALRKKCDSDGCLLIFDEIITGFRFALGGAQELFQVMPDLACFGKSMANGMPISAIVGKREIMKRMEPPDNIFFSGTFFGETLSLAAAIATIAKLEAEDVITRLWSRGQRLQRLVVTMIDFHGLSNVIQTHGYPPFVRLNFSNASVAALFRREMFKTGVLITNSHNIGYAHGEAEITRILSSYEHTLGEIAKALDKGEINVAPIFEGVR